MVHCHVLWNLPFAHILSQMNPLHAVLSRFCQIQINIIANLCLVLHSGLCPSVFCTKPSLPSLLPHMYPVPCTSRHSSCACPNSFGWGVWIMKLLIFQFSQLPVVSSFIGPVIFCSTLFLNTLSLCFYNFLTCTFISIHCHCHNSFSGNT